MRNGAGVRRNLLAIFGADLAVESTPGAGSDFSFSVSLRLA